MAKVIVDKGLAETIKSLRMQNGIAAKDLALTLDKSRSYVSKLENGEIASINSEDLIKGLRFISKESEIDDIIDKVLKTVSIRYTKDEIDRMLWIDNFDKVDRLIPIPDGFAQTYTEILQNNVISIERLVDEINSNLFIPHSILKKRGIPTGRWFKEGDSVYIKMKVSFDDIYLILSGKKKKSNYVILLAIVLYSLRLTEYKDFHEFDHDTTIEILDKATTILENYKVYTLTKKVEIIETAVDTPEVIERLSKHDQDNVSVIGQFNPLLHLYSYYDVASANRLISEFTKNMEWEAPFIMEIAGLPFYELGQCSYRIKKELLEEIRSLLREKCALPEAEKKKEKY